MQTIRIKLLDNSDHKSPFTSYQDYEVSEELTEDEIVSTVKDVIYYVKETYEDEYTDSKIFEVLDSQENFKLVNLKLKELEFIY